PQNTNQPNIHTHTHTHIHNCPCMNTCSHTTHTHRPCSLFTRPVHSVSFHTDTHRQAHTSISCSRPYGICTICSISLHTHIHRHTQTQTHRHTHTHTHRDTQTHRHTQTHTHTHTHTHTRTVYP